MDELDRDDGDAYLTATIQETLRRRPVLPNAAPRLVKQPITIGGWDYPAGVCLVPNAYLVHHDPAIYPDPYAFRPERFLDEQPGTYTWIPFGGGRRRCLGASFALRRDEDRAARRARPQRAAWLAAAHELSRRRAITLSPRGGATTVLRDRSRASRAGGYRGPPPDPYRARVAGGDYETLLYSASDGVATVTLNRPERLNTIVPPMPDELEAAVGRAVRDHDVKVIVVSGAGRSFCAGYDFGGGFHHWDEWLTSDGRWDPGKDFAFATAPRSPRRRSS